MGIKVDYTPVGQVYETAKRAGSVQMLLQQDQRQQEQERFEMQMNAEQDAREFQARVQQEAQSEQYQRALMLATAKSDIDFQSEIAMYQKKRAMMLSEIEQIQNSDILSDANKEELADRAYAKHFGVTLGNTTMENFLEKQQYKMAIVKQLEEQVSQGLMSPEEARNMAAANGVPYSANMFPDEAEELRDDKNKLLVRLSQVQAGLAKFRDFNPWGPKGPRVEIKDIETGETREATKSEVGIRDALIRQAGELVVELEALERKGAVVPQNEIVALEAAMEPEVRAVWDKARLQGVTIVEFMQKLRALEK